MGYFSKLINDIKNSKLLKKISNTIDEEKRKKRHHNFYDNHDDDNCTY